MAKSMHDKLSQILIKNKLVTEKELERAREKQARHGGSLGGILVKEGIITEKDLMSVLSNTFSIPAINLSKYKIEKDCVGIIPEKIARQYRVIAICRLAQPI